MLRLGYGSLCGGLVGAVLLLVLPAGAFKAIVPALIGVALVMVVFQPRLSSGWRPAAGAGAAAGRLPGSRSRGRRPRWACPGRRASRRRCRSAGRCCGCSCLLSGVYGGYFGAAQGVLLLGLMGVAFTDSLQRINAVKNVLAGLVNGVAAVVFIAFDAHRLGRGRADRGRGDPRRPARRADRRKLPPWGLRAVIICVGTAALVKLLA